MCSVPEPVYLDEARNLNPGRDRECEEHPQAIYAPLHRLFPPTLVSNI